ncbi:hypothetical protein [Fodinicurvata sediminis]|uniref:hypothetical protein n=1 Tax=Fodinicurvata sediminis TaxID=1121832 RepID=UPI0004163F4A|nr:hypothetical protein [Fodinicurvata sediminis]
MRLFRLLLLLLPLLLVLYGVWQGRLEFPDRWNPWAPLDVANEPTLVTGWKLGRLRDNDDLCRQALDTSRLAYSALPDSEPQAGCPLHRQPAHICGR